MWLTSEWIKKSARVCSVCVQVRIENHKWKMSLLFGCDIFLSLLLLLWLWSSFNIIRCFDVLWLKCMSFAGSYSSPLKRNYSTSYELRISFFSTKTETACMTPSDNIVYALCNFFVTYGMGYVSCASKTNIVRRWLNYVCLCWLSQIHRLIVCVLALRHK